MALISNQIYLESESNSVESISHFILIFNYDVSNVIRFYYVRFI